MNKDFITIGTILKSVGLRGEVKISPLTDFPERFKRLEEIIVETKEGQYHRYRVQQVRYTPSYVYMTLIGLTSVEEVNSLTGGSIQIPEEERLPLPKGTYYRYEIEGLDVYLEGGDLLGKVDQILQTGSNDVYVVKQGKREYLIPALQTIVKEINVSEKRMIIRPIEGLLEL